MTSRFLNEAQNAVLEMLDAFVMTNSHLARLDGFPEIKVVVNKDFKKDTVAIISGGGSGHEPAHGGYVGDGMLSGAVAGEVFASPSAQSVLAAIKTVTGPQGCLLIVKNYTGDRVNFGLAAERAKSQGYSVDMVIVSDDVALGGTNSIAGRRGVAGTVFVHKVAGATAANGMKLQQVLQIAQKAAASIGSVGVALSSCTLPGHPLNQRISEGKMEVGLGIHGEPGAFTTTICSSTSIVQQILDKFEKAQFNISGQVAIMLNSLGNVPQMELFIVLKDFISQLEEKGADIKRVLVGPYMTSLDMNGISLSVFQVDEQMLDLLDAPTGAPAWPKNVCKEPNLQKIDLPDLGEILEDENTTFAVQSEAGRLLIECCKAGCSALAEVVDELDRIDSLVGDGDCGSTIGRGATAILKKISENKFPGDDAAAAAACLASVARGAMGGTSGAMYDIFFTSAAAQLQAKAPSTPEHWAAVFSNAVNAVSKYGGASVGDRTMLDSLYAASSALNFQQEVDLKKLLQASSDRAVAGAEETASMVAHAGRTSYVPESTQHGVPDPGAKAVAVWWAAVVNTIIHQ